MYVDKTAGHRDMCWAQVWKKERKKQVHGVCASVHLANLACSVSTSFCWMLMPGLWHWARLTLCLPFTPLHGCHIQYNLLGSGRFYSTYCSVTRDFNFCISKQFIEFVVKVVHANVFQCHQLRNFNVLNSKQNHRGLLNDLCQGESEWKFAVFYHIL